MPSANEYRIKAAELNALGKNEPDQLARANFINLALAYLRLAEQAEKNAATDIVYETPSAKVQHHQQQQQQQPQPGDKKDS
jgi:hypothetical protein